MLELPSWNDYGPIRKGRDYKITAEGRDWYAIKLQGKRLFVPSWVFEQ